jgi:hypothetical protein
MPVVLYRQPCPRSGCGGQLEQRNDPAGFADFLQLGGFVAYGARLVGALLQGVRDGWGWVYCQKCKVQFIWCQHCGNVWLPAGVVRDGEVISCPDCDRKLA